MNNPELFNPKTKLVVIVGPTASGKSDVAIELAKRVDGEIISADSMQIYKGMNIGTAKVTPDEMQGVPHHLIDIIDPAEPFSVADYQKMARQLIEEISERGKVPILVGGTGLYVRSVIDRLEFPAGDIASEIRKKLEERARDEGASALYKELIEKDPAATEIVHPNNVRRIIRALEVIELTGRPFSEIHRHWKARDSLYDVAMFGLAMDREKLRERINRRVDLMIESGLPDEVKILLDAGYEKFLTSQQAIGYKELSSYLKNEVSLGEAIDTLKARTRQYAKRQLTWFRADPRIHWVDVDEKPFGVVAEEILSELNKRGFFKGARDEI